VYQHLGNMGTIGRKAAVVDFGVFKLSGVVAVGVIHIAFLANMRSRASVAMDWFWAYLTLRSSTRLITGGELSIGESAE
jgi:NADH dehydrogenase FAD-containing subunit